MSMNRAFVKYGEYGTVTPGVFFHKGILTRFEDRRRETKDITIPGTRQVVQRSTGCHPFLTEVNFEVVGTVILKKMKGYVY